MSNLTNLYAYLRDKYADIDMVLGKSPSFVKSLMGIDNQKIVFIYKEDKSSKFYQSPTEDKSNETKFNYSASYGSPLKDDDSINNLLNTSVASKILSKNPWKEAEDHFDPIDANLAQEIMNDIANNEIAKKSRGWIIILCGNSTSKNATFLLTFQASSNNFTRGFAKYYGFVKNEERSIKKFLQIQSSMLPRKTPEIQIESTFEVTPNISLKFINNMSEDVATLSHINSLSSVNLFQKIEIGKSHALCEQLWSQIELLYMIKNDIVNVKNNSYDGTLAEVTYNYGSMKYEDLQEKVNQILTVVAIPNENFDDAKDISLETVMKRVVNRPLVEITDQLWELLKYAGSFSDLRKILAFIFQISSRSSIINIPMNNNRLGELIRELSQQRIAIPTLSSTEPLELLLEIGIEKVLKDYEYMYSESKICMLSDINIGETKVSQKDTNMNVRKSLAASAVEVNRQTLLHGAKNLNGNDDYYGIKNSRFNEQDSEQNISKIAQIHLAMEHILMIQNNLNLNTDYNRIAKKILENPIISFEDLQAQKYDKLQIPINDKKVVQLVDNLMPNSQKVIIKSDNKFKNVENVFYFNIEQIVPSLVRKESDGEVIEKKTDTFHFINYATITSKY